MDPRLGAGFLQMLCIWLHPSLTCSDLSSCPLSCHHYTSPVLGGWRAVPAVHQTSYLKFFTKTLIMGYHTTEYLSSGFTESIMSWQVRSYHKTLFDGCYSLLGLAVWPTLGRGLLRALCWWKSERFFNMFALYSVCSMYQLMLWKSFRSSGLSLLQQYLRRSVAFYSQSIQFATGYHQVIDSSQEQWQ